VVLQEMAPDRASECAADAATHARHHAGVAYPRWYLKRWHFLPEGYLSRRSARGYDGLVRRVYYAGVERRVQRALVDALSQQSPADVLDLGCGPGRTLRALGAAFPDAQLTGVDLSPYMLDLAQRRTAAFDKVRLVHADVTELPFEAASYDAVCASHLVGHLPPGPAAAAVAEARRVLRPGGRLYVIDHAWHRRLDNERLRDGECLAAGLIRFSVLRP
jgi:ubiquinone/menaquinone biosynthesis C-methylase UbiE